MINISDETLNASISIIQESNRIDWSLQLRNAQNCSKEIKFEKITQKNPKSKHG